MKPEYATADILDVVIIGAGPAGLGCAVALDRLGIENYAVMERGKVGESFKNWPREMRFITPSFCGHAFGQLDLNAIAIATSPGYSLNKEHPGGRDYASYLRDLAAHFELPVNEHVTISGIAAVRDNAEVGFELQTSEGLLPTRYLIWAGGEFQFPKLDSFPGAEHCVHNASILSWRELEGPDRIVIGGGESAIDAAVSLVHSNKSVLVLAREATWESKSSDPSVSLTPYTYERLRKAQSTQRLTLTSSVDVCRVEESPQGYVVFDRQERSWKTRARPIMATGFEGHLNPMIKDLFEKRDDGFPRINAVDESTIVPGLFLSGPMVRHEQVILCFIYKYRQRFAIIAKEIGRRLGIATEKLTSLEHDYRKAGMFLDDLSCCGDECAC